jgi:hypothetical protein
MKKLLFIIFILLFFPAVASAQTSARMVLQGAPTAVSQQQQFYVDVAVDAQGTSFNGIQGRVTFSSDTLSFVRAETGTSLVTYFIDPPTANGNTVSFSGIIIGGFDGLINPFDQSHKLPGEIVRLVFVGKAVGNATISTSKVTVTANDGQGTLENVADNNVSLDVSTAVSPSVYATADTVPPTISAVVVHESDLYNGKYALLFTANDKQTGIAYVELREGSGAWNTIQSPYLLQDQSRHSILSLRAHDVAGNVTTITIAQSASSQSAAAIILILIVLIILYAIHKKTKHPKHHLD